MTDKSAEAMEIENSLKQTVSYVRDCEARIIKGEIMDLQGLDNTVIELCEKITELPSKEAQDLQEQMDVLIKGLEGLASTIEEHKEDGEA